MASSWLGFALLRGPASPAREWPGMLFLQPAAEAEYRSAALSIDLWQWLVAASERRVCLRGCDPFPHGQTLRLVYWVLFLSLRLCARARWFFLRAWFPRKEPVQFRFRPRARQVCHRLLDKRFDASRL